MPGHEPVKEPPDPDAPAPIPPQEPPPGDSAIQPIAKED